MTKLEYLAHRRRMVALDEWGYYFALTFLLFMGLSQNWIWFIPFWLALPYGGFCVYIGYKGYWDLEKEIKPGKRISS